MPTITATHTKDTVLQIRLPAHVKRELEAQAKYVGMNVSEYARANLITRGAFKRQAKFEKFWKEVAESEAEMRAGKGTLTSAAELIEIMQKARRDYRRKK